MSFYVLLCQHEVIQKKALKSINFDDPLIFPKKNFFSAFSYSFVQKKWIDQNK